MDEEMWQRLSASEVACYRYPDDTELAKAQRAAFIDGFVMASKRREAMDALLSSDD